MATIEQCRTVMRQKFKTMKDVEDVCMRLQKSVVSNDTHWPTHEKKIAGNIDSIIDWVLKHENQLDRLCVILDLPTGGEASRQDADTDREFNRKQHKDNHRLAMAALILSVIAILVSVVNVLVDWYR